MKVLHSKFQYVEEIRLLIIIWMDLKIRSCIYPVGIDYHATPFKSRHDLTNKYYFGQISP